jgi:hypothetical protein
MRIPEDVLSLLYTGSRCCTNVTSWTKPSPVTLVKATLRPNAKNRESFEDLYSILKHDYKHVPHVFGYIESTMMLTKHEWAEYICQYMPSFGSVACHILKAHMAASSVVL